MQRRDVLRAASIASLGLGLPALGLLSQGSVQAQSSADYKALVCVYLFGGNDSHNMMVPYESAAHAAYLQMRPEYSSSTKKGVGVPLNALLPLTPADGGSPVQGFHPSMANLRTRFENRQVAVLQNVGTLVEPLTRDSLYTRQRPVGLGAHDDQQYISMLALQDPQGIGSEHGWGARLWRRWAQSAGISAHDLAMVSFTGVNRWQASSEQALSALQSNATVTLDYPSEMAQLIADGQQSARAFTRAYANKQASAYRVGDSINTVFGQSGTAAQQAFVTASGNLTSGIYGQLLSVARMIEGRNQLGVPGRQIFFVSLGGFDTHSTQYVGHANLLVALDKALHAFMSAMETLGMSQQVTAFTMSDFSRTLRMNASNGTDHGWAGHNLVVGGAVKGGLYGRTANHEPTSQDISPSNRNMVIPSLSINQMGATLGSWMGVADTDLREVFPHLRNFSTTNLGFMNV